MKFGERTEFEAPIVSVTLFEDRARIVRRGSATLDEIAGGRLVVPGIAPVAVDKTLLVRVLGEAPVAILDARLKRTLVSESEASDTSPKHAALATELRGRERRERGLRAEAELADAEVVGLGRLATWTIADLADDVRRGRGFGTSTLGELEPLRQREREAAKRASRQWHELSTYQDETERLREQLATLTTPQTSQWCGVLLDVSTESEGGSVEIEIEYVVGAAMWRPLHRATLLSGSSSNHESRALRVETTACVWQNTGVDWDNVDLRFSTERASLGAEPPHLGTDLLSVEKRQDQLVVESREQDVDKLSATEVAASELPGIDDGGSAVLLRSPEPTTVRTDGQPLLVKLSEFETQAAVAVWAFPELSPVATLRSVAKNMGTNPLLAGPVELIRDGGWVGRTTVSFVAAGEEFELAWGQLSDLRIVREVSNSQEKGRSLSSWNDKRRTVRLKLSNIGTTEHTLNVRERVPVSEIEKLKIEFDDNFASQGKQPDDDGFIDWKLDLAGRSNRDLKFRYVIRRHKDVVATF